MKQINAGMAALAVVMSSLIVQQQARAETYRGIGYSYTINDVKAMFPGANFEDQKVAWAKPGEKLISITGEGITGSIRIFFRDARPSYPEIYRSYWTAFGTAALKHTRPASTEPYIVEPEIIKKAERFAATQSDDKGYEAQWVRWVPDAPIAFSRLVNKFGMKVKYIIDDQDYSINAIWESKGVLAPLTDDKKYAAWVEFQFSPAEQRQGIERRIKRIIEAISVASKASDSVSSQTEGNAAEAGAESSD